MICPRPPSHLSERPGDAIRVASVRSRAEPELAHLAPTLLCPPRCSPPHPLYQSPPPLPVAAEITTAECETLNDYLGPKTPSGCFVLGHNQDDKFTIPSDQPFEGKDATHHRNSWLWPRLARRATQGSKMHPSKWRQPVNVSGEECAAIYEGLKAKLGQDEAIDELPVACKKFVN